MCSDTQSVLLLSDCKFKNNFRHSDIFFLPSQALQHNVPVNTLLAQLLA